ncbi:hypothetical protein HII31_07471 [Pseudocercospora fuligena]|uniref:Chitin-binding type-4 domain-containing protein n=1 Tax=Pseudocercospora fuligena TaxID=685502 RepID=A0A8H6RI06_9PEZI|nr:hypothetical protein HII31_07471 [Pseudocercospora fuligena]
MHSVAALTALLSLSALGINALPAAQAQNNALVQCNPAREDCTGKQVFCNPAREDCSGKNKPIADNKWTISKVYIGCGNDPAKGGAFCSYEFDVEGKETADLPGFSAHCYQRNTPRDGTIRQCQMTGGWSSTKPNRSVKSIDASVQLFPKNAQQSKLTVQLTWDQKDSASAGITNIWRASQTGNYQFFSQDMPKSLDMIPTYYQAVAVT